MNKVIQVMDKKKEREFSQLCKALSLIEERDYTFLDTDGESPDFLLNTTGKVLGVELTSIFRELGDGNSAKTQSDLPKLGEDAVCFYHDLGGQPFSFYFCFQGSESIVSRRKVSQSLGKWLFDTMKCTRNNCLSNSELNLTNLPPDLRRITELIFAYPSQDCVSSSVVLSMFQSKKINESFLKPVIRKKEQLIRKYKEKCEIIWLLIVLPSLTLSADLELCDGSIAMEFAFDSIYVFDEYRNKISKIKKIKVSS